MPEYLDYQEKNFYQKFMLKNILLKEQNNNYNCQDQSTRYY